MQDDDIPAPPGAAEAHSAVGSLRHNILHHMRMDSMLHLIRLPLCMTDPNAPDNPIVYANQAFLDLTGYRMDEVEGRNCRFLQGPETRAESLEELREAIAKYSTAVVEIINYRKDGSRFINSLQISPVRDEDGQVVFMFGSQMDVTDKREQASEKQKLATTELVHRLKNIVNVMSSVIRLSSQEIADRNELLDKIQQRLRALSDSHFHSLDFQSGPPIDAQAITALVAKPYAPDHPDALSISGVSAPVGADHVSALSLVLHELATNAAKHGAFSRHGGQVSVVWSQTPDARNLTMTWTESNGPPVEPSERASGSKMIARLLKAAGGELAYDWRPEGLVAKITIPAFGAV